MTGPERKALEEKFQQLNSKLLKISELTSELQMELHDFWEDVRVR